MQPLEILRSKIVELPALLRQLQMWRLKSERIVFTNGCFDILHAGHIHLLAEAAEQGKRLIIGLNSDASVRDIKKPGRPLNEENSRALILAALGLVDAVVLFSEKTPEILIQEIKPDVLVKGGDYAADEIVGAGFVKSLGGRIHIVPLLEGFSTTNLETKIRNS